MVLPIPDPPAAALRQGFNATVAEVRFDRNATGSSRSAHGGPLKDYQPVAGRGPFRCYAEPYVDRDRVNDSKPGQVVTWFLMIQDPYGADLDRNYQVVVTQDGATRSHLVSVTGRARDETGRGLYWVAEGVEYLA